MAKTSKAKTSKAKKTKRSRGQDVGYVAQTTKRSRQIVKTAVKRVGTLRKKVVKALKSR